MAQSTCKKSTKQSFQREIQLRIPHRSTRWRYAENERFFCVSDHNLTIVSLFQSQISKLQSKYTQRFSVKQNMQFSIIARNNWKMHDFITSNCNPSFGCQNFKSKSFLCTIILFFSNSSPWHQHCFEFVFFASFVFCFQMFTWHHNFPLITVIVANHYSFRVEQRIEKPSQR
jgi:hypothetical protein